MKKVLIIRFSSIGDIVLTTPVIRCLKNSGDYEVHYITKASFKSVLDQNPYIDQLHFIKNDVNECIEDLKKENFDWIVDLHHNLRSHRLLRALDRPAVHFRKHNLQKWVLVNFKYNALPDVHIVDRYMDTVRPLNVVNDDQGLDYFIAAADEIPLDFLPSGFEKYVGFVIGGQHDGKMCSAKKIARICQELDRPVVLLGGPEDQEKGDWIAKECGKNVYNTAGQFPLNQSAWLVKNAEVIITHDTGLMHIAAAFKKKIISLWGGTVPELGMYPYRPGKGSKILEVKHFMRPSSKLGTRKGIYKLWNFMDMIPDEEIIEAVNN